MSKDTSKRELVDGKWLLDGIDFDGHFVEWGFSYEPKTYLKESELIVNEKPALEKTIVSILENNAQVPHKHPMNIIKILTPKT